MSAPATHPVLTGESVKLRLLTEHDLQHLHDMLQQPGVVEWWSGYDAARLRADTLDTPSVTSLAIELDGGLIGLIMYTEETDPYYRSAGIDITLDASLVGRGLGTDALRTLARHLFDARGHHRLTIDPAVGNERAIAAYQKVGFRPVGVMRQYEKGADGTWHDNLLMDMLAGELR